MDFADAYPGIIETVGISLMESRVRVKSSQKQLYVAQCKIELLVPFDTATYW